ncbi:cytidine deaminase [Caldivirga sp. UBA161]|uniref:cytidine deaminase n=1 Tax=Caldivirga sp. UBA161 TaxID=1915569 RepID=UPI0025C6D6BD|nr:cytidine deaminase [Caldivirga sp. UBA161]
MDEEVNRAIKMAESYLSNSYSPYSGIKVASVAITSDGKMFPGVNVENSSYGLTICAERVAVFRAVTEGYRRIKAVVVVSNHDEIYPCGACLQVMAEFNVEEVYVASRSGVKRFKLSELLPRPFNLKYHET